MLRMPRSVKDREKQRDRVQEVSELTEREEQHIGSENLGGRPNEIEGRTSRKRKIEGMLLQLLLVEWRQCGTGEGTEKLAMRDAASNERSGQAVRGREGGAAGLAEKKRENREGAAAARRVGKQCGNPRERDRERLRKVGQQAAEGNSAAPKETHFIRSFR